MRILVSIESRDCLNSLQGNLAAFISTLEEQEEINIDVLHVYNPVKVTDSLDLKDKLEEINKDERKSKVKFISECENSLESYLQNELGKTSLVNSFLLEGDYREKIKHHITFHSYSLLVLVPREKINFGEILAGRNTHWVIDNLEVPVLLLPTQLELDKSMPPSITCFIDEKPTFENLQRSELLQAANADNKKFIHYGRHKICEGVTTINSDNINQSLKELTGNKKSNQIYVLVHKNKGDFLNFLNKSFTKTVISNLENPLLIF